MFSREVVHLVVFCKSGFVFISHGEVPAVIGAFSIHQLVRLLSVTCPLRLFDYTRLLLLSHLGTVVNEYIQWSISQYGGHFDFAYICIGNTGVEQQLT